MNSKATAFIIAALSSTAVFAQSSHHRAVPFGDEVVTLKFSNIPSRFGELQQLWDATNEAASPVEQERLLRIRWEDYGDTIALQSPQARSCSQEDTFEHRCRRGADR